MLARMFGKWRRVTSRLRKRVAARRREQVLTVHPATGLPYARVRHVNSPAELRRHWRRASWTCSRRNPELMVVIGGRYEVALLGVDGLDVYGPGAALVSRDDRDVLDAQGRSMLLHGLTIRHRGAGYAIHADAPGEAAELVLVDVQASSTDKAGIGLGLFGGQAVYAYRCTFRGEWTGVHAHNALDQAEPATFVFQGCDAELSFDDLGSGQADRWLVDVDKPPSPRRLPAHAKTAPATG